MHTYGEMQTKALDSSGRRLRAWLTAVVYGLHGTPQPPLPEFRFFLVFLHGQGAFIGKRLPAC